MSLDAVRGDDAIAFYAASLGPTYLLACGIASAQSSDQMGPLPPGRYLIQATDIIGGAITWLRLRPFVPGAVEVAVVGAPDFPMRAAGIVALEVNVLKGVNDRVAAVTSVGTANLYITRISRDA